MTIEMQETNSVELATELTIAWLSNPNTRVSAEDVPAFLKSMHDAVASLAAPVSVDSEDAAEPVEDHVPAVTARKSLATEGYIISMIDGKKYRSLTRHLSAKGITPSEYRERYGLKNDYPMVAPAYSKHRSEIAKKLGLGRKPGQKMPVKPEAALSKMFITYDAATAERP